jgi:ABC-2 type transport system permease protein
MGLELLIPRFLSLASSFFISFLAYSSLLTTLSVLYHTSDHKVLLVSPIPLSLFLIQKSLEIALRSGITLIFLSLPPAVALGMQLGLGWIFYAAFTVNILALAGFASAVGILAGMGLMALFPARRMHQTIAIIGLCFAVILITGIRFLHLETLWSEEAVANPLVLFLQTDSGWTRYSPGVLFSLAMLPLIQGQSAGAWSLANLGLGLFSGFLLLAMGRRLFLRGWFKIQEKADSHMPTPNHGVSRWGAWLPFPAAFRALVWKEWLIFRRDPAVWTQVFMMIPLGAIYLLNLSFLPLDEGGLQTLFATANLGLIGLIVAAIGARFLFPSASREGRAVWTLAAAPISAQMQILQKGFFAIPPVLLLGLILLGVSSHVLHLSAPLGWTMLGLGGLMCLQLSWLAVCLGFVFPTYNYKHLMEVSLGKGSFVFMGLAVSQIGWLEYGLWKQADRMGAVTIALDSAWIWLWMLFWGGVTAWAYQAGKRRCPWQEN